MTQFIFRNLLNQNDEIVMPDDENATMPESLISWKIQGGYTTLQRRKENYELLAISIRRQVEAWLTEIQSKV